MSDVLSSHFGRSCICYYSYVYERIGVCIAYYNIYSRKCLKALGTRRINGATIVAIGPISTKWSREGARATIVTFTIKGVFTFIVVAHSRSGRGRRSRFWARIALEIEVTFSRHHVTLEEPHPGICAICLCAEANRIAVVEVIKWEPGMIVSNKGLREDVTFCFSVATVGILPREVVITALFSIDVDQRRTIVTAIMRKKYFPYTKTKGKKKR